jgi:hypothetical protein
MGHHSHLHRFTFTAYIKFPRKADEISSRKPLIFRVGILGHQFNKRLESFAPYPSQSLLFLVRFERKPYSSLVLKILTKKNPRNQKT